MLASLIRHRADLTYSSTLLLIASVPLVVLRNAPVGPAIIFAILIVSAVAWLAALRLWRLAARADDPPAAPAFHGPAWRRAAVVAALAALTAVNFFLPLCRRFWGGGDEHVIFTPWGCSFWCDVMDRFAGRPLNLSIGLGRLLTPDRVEGFLILSALLCLANGLLLAGILARLFHGDWFVPLAAGTLLIVHPCDESRFYAIWTSMFYWMALFLLLAAVRLCLASYDRGSRPLLAAACVALTAAGLTHEGTLPLACLAPVLLWAASRERRRFFPWAFAWYGTIALLAARFVVHLLADHGGGYQAQILSSAGLTPGRLAANASAQLLAVLSYFRTPPGVVLKAFWLPCAAAAVAFAVACVAARNGQVPGPRLKRSLAGAGLAAVTVGLGLLPFLPMSRLFRTQFLAAPGQASLLACAAGAVVSLLPRRVRGWAGAAGVGCLLVGATAGAYAGQNRARAEEPISFERCVDVLDHVHAVSPHYAPGTLVLLLPDGAGDSPFGWNTALDFIAYNTMDDTFVVQAPLSGPPPVGVSFTARGVLARNHIYPVEKLYAYDAVVAFRLTRGGEVTLLPRIPDFLLPAGADASTYAPLTRMRPGAVTPLPFFRLPWWEKPPQDVFDYRGGVLAGAGWGAKEGDGWKVVRRARDGAELLVNPAGQGSREIHFFMDAGGASAAGVEALDDDGRVAASAEAGPGGEVRLDLPLESGRVNRFRLRAAGHSFRVFRPGKCSPPRTGPWGRPQDVNGPDVMIGKNWGPAEGASEGKPFRWVENDAEIGLIPPASGATLRLEVEPGAGMGGRPCALTLSDGRGRHLATRTVMEHAVLFFPVPQDAAVDATLRLHCTGGGDRAGDDPRILNFRVFRAELTDDAPNQLPPPTDVNGDGLSLGKNWGQAEGVREGRPFRWVENGAEIRLDSPIKVVALRLEVEPGVGMGGRPCVLTLTDGEDRVLAARTVTAHAVVLFPVPQDASAGATFRVHCANGGERVPNDSRVMNFRVFRAELTDEGRAPGG